jgi:hypothetical protein
MGRWRPHGRQTASVKPQEKAITVPDAKAVPSEPSMTKPADSNALAASHDSDKGKIVVTTVPDGAEVYVDDDLVGNAPATLRLPSGKHTVKVSQQGYKPWTKQLSVFGGSETTLKASLEKE